MRPALQRLCMRSINGRAECALSRSSAGVVAVPNFICATLPYPSGKLCRRKQRQITLQLDDLGMENLETQLHDATERPSEPRHRFATLVMVFHPRAKAHACLSRSTAVKPLHEPMRSKSCSLLRV